MVKAKTRKLTAIATTTRKMLNHVLLRTQTLTMGYAQASGHEAGRGQFLGDQPETDDSERKVEEGVTCKTFPSCGNDGPENNAETPPAPPGAPPGESPDSGDGLGLPPGG